MTTSPPHLPPIVTTGGGGGSQRLQSRLRKIVISSMTIAATAWCITLGPIPGILACAVAKHILVAVLVMGYDVVESPA